MRSWAATGLEMGEGGEEEWSCFVAWSNGERETQRRGRRAWLWDLRLAGGARGVRAPETLREVVSPGIVAMASGWRMNNNQGVGSDGSRDLSCWCR